MFPDSEEPDIRTSDHDPKEGIFHPVMEYIPEDLLKNRNVFHRIRNIPIPVFPRFRQLSTVSPAPITMTTEYIYTMIIFDFSTK